MSTVQYFSDAYLEQCKSLSAEQIVQFLEDFRLIHGSESDAGSKLISIRIETDLLNAFKMQAKLDGVHYQSRIKELMRRSLTRPDP